MHTNRAEFRIRTYHINIDIDSFSFWLQVWGSLTVVPMDCQQRSRKDVIARMMTSLLKWCHRAVLVRGITALHMYLAYLFAFVRLYTQVLASEESATPEWSHSTIVPLSIKESYRGTCCKIKLYIYRGLYIYEESLHNVFQILSKANVFYMFTKM